MPRNVEPRPQSIYNIESSSALYGLSMNIELWRIGTVNDKLLKDRDKRVTATLLAIAEVLKGAVRLGGHWSNYKPLWSVESAVAVFSQPTPTPTYPPTHSKYIQETIRLAETNREILAKAGLNPRIKVLALYGTEKRGQSSELVEETSDIGQFLKRLVELGEEYGKTTT